DRQNSTATGTDKRTIVTQKAMSATVHILRGCANSGKTSRLMERCRELAGRGTLLWLGPSRRRVEQLKAKLAGVPELLARTFTDLAGEIVVSRMPEARPLSRCQARLLVEEVLGELQQKQQLAHFERVAETRGFAQGVTELLSELQSQGIDPETFRQA